MIYRNGMTFTNEADWNDWAVNEVDLIIMNTEKYYNEIMLRNRFDKKMNGLIVMVMKNHNIKIKKKNIKLNIELINEYLKDLNKWNYLFIPY